MKEFIIKFIFLCGLGKLSTRDYKNIFYSLKSSESASEAFKSDHLVILTNHMTLVDSTILHRFLFEVFGYVGTIKNNFRPLVWNLSASENTEMLMNTHKNAIIRYAVKRGFNRALLINRKNTDDSNATFAKLVELTVKDKHVFNIFPEAGRTREIEFNKNNIMPGAAKAIYDIKKQTGEFPRILCVYIRSENQKGHSDYPTEGKIHIVARLLDMRINENESPLRQRKNISDQIGLKLEELQDIWKVQVRDFNQSSAT